MMVKLLKLLDPVSGLLRGRGWSGLGLVRRVGGGKRVLGWM
jgi:hypothetical protein